MIPLTLSIHAHTHTIARYANTSTRTIYAKNKCSTSSMQTCKQNALTLHLSNLCLDFLRQISSENDKIFFDN